MLGRMVNQSIHSHGYLHPWGNVLPLLKEHDFILGNLETTLTTSQHLVPKVFNFKADPDVIQTLQQGNISAVTLANNHILDFSEKGLLETIDVLDAGGILHVGAGKNKEDAEKHIVVEKQGIRLGILGFTDNEPNWLATEKKSGTNYITIGDTTTVKSAIEKIRDTVDILIITLHWGPNNREVPTQVFQDFARALIDFGADIIHGHSAHIFQGIELYKQKVIFYDTGDFVDDYQVDPLLRNDLSFLFSVEVTKGGLQKIVLTPTVIHNCQVNLAIGKDHQHSILRIQQLSAAFGTILYENNKRLQADLCTSP